jgi:hypothetical protein
MKHTGIYQQNGNGWKWHNSGFIWENEDGKYITECFNYVPMTKEQLKEKFKIENYTYRFNI